MRQDGINKALGIGYRELASFQRASRVGRDNLLMTFDGHDAGTYVWLIIGSVSKARCRVHGKYYSAALYSPQ